MNLQRNELEFWYKITNRWVEKIKIELGQILFLDYEALKTKLDLEYRESLIELEIKEKESRGLDWGSFTWNSSAPPSLIQFEDKLKEESYSFCPLCSLKNERVILKDRIKLLESQIDRLNREISGLLSEEKEIDSLDETSLF